MKLLFRGLNAVLQRTFALGDETELCDHDIAAWTEAHGQCTQGPFKRKYELRISGNCTSLRAATFYDDSAIEKLTMADDSLQKVGNFAFHGCTSMVSVDIGTNVKTIGFSAFEGCSSLGSFDVPPDLRVIDSCCFAGCTSLRSIQMSASVSAIYNGAFLSAGLTTVDLTGVRSLGPRAFKGCKALRTVVLGEQLCLIGRSAFEGCSGLTAIDIPASVKLIEESTFACCTSLVSVTMGDEVGEIGTAAFEQCSSIVRIVLPAELRVLSPRVFAHCSSLESVAVPHGLREIGYGAFDDCGALRSMVANSVTRIDFNAFRFCRSLAYVEFPVVETVEQDAFYLCSTLERFIGGSTLQKICDRAFLECTALEFFPRDMPDLQMILGGAFSGCRSLSGLLRIGANVVAVGACAFEHTGYSMVIIEGRPVISEKAFYNMASLLEFYASFVPAAYIGPHFLWQCPKLVVVWANKFPAKTRVKALVMSEAECAAEKDIDLVGTQASIFVLPAGSVSPKWREIMQKPTKRNDEFWNIGKWPEQQEPAVLGVRRIYASAAVAQLLQKANPALASIPRELQALPDPASWASTQLWLWWSSPTAAGYAKRRLCKDSRIVSLRRRRLLFFTTVYAAAAARQHPHVPFIPPDMWPIIFTFVRHDVPPL